MQSFVIWFQEGGIFMSFILLVDLVAFGLLVASLVCCTMPVKKIIDKIALGIFLLPLILGALGHYHGYATAMSVLPSVDPALKPELYEMSMRMAAIPSYFGGFSTLFFLVVWLIAFVVCRRLQKNRRT